MVAERYVGWDAGAHSNGADKWWSKGTRLLNSNRVAATGKSTFQNANCQFEVGLKTAGKRSYQPLTVSLCLDPWTKSVKEYIAIRILSSA